MHRALNSISHLVRDKGYINGKWVGGSLKFRVFNPATQEAIGLVETMGKSEARDAISCAASVQTDWAGKSGYERGKVLRRWMDTIREHRNALGILVTLETGKPLKDALGEIDLGVSFLEWYSEEARRNYGQLIPSTSPDRQQLVLREAIGPCAMITPWNFPVMLVLRKVAAAMAAGCTVVVKPSEETPLSALSLAELGDRAGIPPGVFNVLPTDRDGSVAIGEEFCNNRQVRVLSFTGSSVVGKQLYRMAAGQMKRVLLELGGNAPFIVFPSADMETTLRAISVAKFRNNGQACIAANRVMVHASRLSEFCERSKQLLENMRVGNGMEEGVQLGPLINQSALEKMERLVSDGVSKGARVVTGGRRLGDTGDFYPPTLLTGVEEGMLPWREEIFGPILSVCTFSSEEEVIRRANEVSGGLMAYVMSSDYKQIHRTISRLHYGMIGVNEALVSLAVTPAGGVKGSGTCREGGREGMQEYLETKFVCLGGLTNS